MGLREPTRPPKGDDRAEAKLRLSARFLAGFAGAAGWGLATACAAPLPPVDAWMKRADARLLTPASSPLHAAREALSANAHSPVEAHDERRWTTLFDGQDLTGWQAGVYGDTDEMEFTSDGVVIPIGVPLSGITYLREPPRGAYCLEVEATPQYGADFFLGLTFPVQDEHVTLVLGGWGGGLCGLSCIDGLDASENDTRTHRGFPNGKRQTVLVEVTPTRIRASTNGEPLVDTSIVGKELGLRMEVTPSRPLGVASFATRTTLHSVRVAPLDE